MLENVKWGEFKIGDLFEKLPAKYLGEGNKFENVSKIKNKEYNTPLVYAKAGDNGIMYWGKEGHFTTYENVISIVYNGAIATGLVYAQKEKTGILGESYFIKIKNREVSFSINLFLQRALEKVLYTKYSREFLATWADKVENDYLSLPVTPEGDIDYNFMKTFITEIEKSKTYEIDCYLIENNLKDYTLTSEEEKALEDFKTSKWGEFNLCDLFDIKNTNNILSRDIIENSGNYPYLCASRENNGINSYISYNEKLIDKGNCIFIGGKTFVVTYQEKDFYSNDSHNLALYLKNKEKSKINQLFFIACINKSLSPKYSWGDSISNKKIQTDRVKIPLTPEGDIDYNFMETFIKAVEKLVIKDVVDYNNKRLEATKTLIK